VSVRGRLGRWGRKDKKKKIKKEKEHNGVCMGTSDCREGGRKKIISLPFAESKGGNANRYWGFRKEKIGIQNGKKDVITVEHVWLKNEDSSLMQTQKKIQKKGGEEKI